MATNDSIQVLGALALEVANLGLAFGAPLAASALGWIAFFALTIGGERLELSRMLPPSLTGRAAFIAIVALFLLGATVATLSLPSNVVVLSASLLALAMWLLRHDIARKTIRQQGLTRFIAACLFSGYAWLLIGGLIGLWSPILQPGSSYDAFLHAVFVGFVFSMIFGHAPVIFPAVARVKIPYHHSFYLPLIVLHASLIARVAGDLLQIPHCRSLGGALNGVALALFVLSTIAAVIRGKRQS